MKKIISLAISLILAVGCFAAVPFESAAEEDPESAFTYEIIEGEVSITGLYKNVTGELVIPDRIDDYPVKSIDERAFLGCEFVSAVIPGSIKEISDGSFTGCENLTSVIIKDGVKMICREAFSGCTALTDVSIPDSVESINEFAFDRCQSLSVIKIPESVIYVGGDAFRDTAAYVDESNWDGDVFYYGDILAYADPDGEFDNAEYVVRDGTRLIADGAFETNMSDGTELKKVSIPEGTEYIGYYAFYGRRGLATVELPKSIKAIGGRAFDNTEVVMPEPGEYEVYIGTALIEYFGDAESYTVKPGTTVIADGAFAYGLVSSVILPESLKYISDSAFAGCANLKDVTVNGFIERIGECAFSGCTALEKAEFLNGVGYIGECAFHNCPALTKVTISEGVGYIGDNAFSECTGLKSVNIGGSNLTIDDRAFFNASALEEAVITGMVRIGDEAFSGCSALGAFELAEGIEYIGKGAFSGCSALESIKLPEGMSYLGDCAFEDCASLASVKIGDGITKIESATFFGCESLASIEIPDTVTDIWRDTFCDTLLGDKSRYEDGALYVGNILMLYEDYSARKYAIKEGTRLIANGAFAVDKNFKSLTIPEGVTHIGEDAFWQMKGVSELRLPESVVSIGNRAFAYCTGLTSINLPEGIGYIGDEAFCECKALESVKLPASAEKIGKGTFKYCTSLSEVTIPEGITAIGNDAFTGCAGLESIVIPKSVTEIGEAFSGCDRLYEITIPFVGKSRNAVEDDSFFGAIFGESQNSLRKVTVTDAEKIPDMAFSKFSGYQFGQLSEVILSEGISAIGEAAFFGCDRLYAIAIPKSVKTIGEAAFSDCKGLEKVTLYNKLETIGRSAFDNCNIESVVFVGKQGDWAKISIAEGNESLTGAPITYVNPVVPGDVTGDGEVTRSDLLRLAKYFSGFEVELDMDAADVTGDGSVTRSDLLRLAKYFSGFDVKLGE